MVSTRTVYRTPIWTSVVQRRIAAATVELVAGDREKISPSEKFMQAPEKSRSTSTATIRMIMISLFLFLLLLLLLFLTHSLLLQTSQVGRAAPYRSSNS
jgi:type VI protein secretion system component VasF